MILLYLIFNFLTKYNKLEMLRLISAQTVRTILMLLEYYNECAYLLAIVANAQCADSIDF